jgi:hypothetical protein
VPCDTALTTDCELATSTRRSEATISTASPKNLPDLGILEMAIWENGRQTSDMNAIRGVKAVWLSCSIDIQVLSQIDRKSQPEFYDRSVAVVTVAEICM